MSKLKLNIGSLIQGTLDFKAVNIAFVFQVNCPGCFIYGIPAMNLLYQRFQEKIGFIGVSTAFEDFEFNNIANTELLLREGTTVGETKKYLSQVGEGEYWNLPLFPVGFDKMSTANEFLTKENIDFLIKDLTQAKGLNPIAEAALSQRIKDHYQQVEILGETFILNQLRGTPSFIIFKKDFEIIDHSFGQQPEGRLAELLEKSLL